MPEEEEPESDDVESDAAEEGGEDVPGVEETEPDAGEARVEAAVVQASEGPAGTEKDEGKE
jgi:hypothetical protein